MRYLIKSLYIFGVLLVTSLIVTAVYAYNECADEINPPYSLNYEGDTPGAKIKISNSYTSTDKYLSGQDHLDTDGKSTVNRKGGFFCVYAKAFLGRRIEESGVKVRAEMLPHQGTRGKFIIDIKLRYYASAKTVQAIAGCKGQTKFYFKYDGEKHSTVLGGPTDSEWFIDQVISLASLLGGEAPGNIGTAFDMIGYANDIQDIKEVKSNLEFAAENGEAKTYDIVTEPIIFTEGVHTFRIGMKADALCNAFGTAWAYGFGEIVSVSITPIVCPDQNGGSGGGGGGGGGGADSQKLR